MRALVPKLSLSFIMMGLGIACAYAAATTTPSPSRAPLPQYNLLLSKNEKLCGALHDFYDRHARNRDSLTAGYLEDQFGREVQRDGIEFLSESANWQPQGNDYWTLQIPMLDVYNDGTSRAVILLDSGINYNFSSFSTEVLVLKPGTDIAGVEERLRFDRDFVEQVVDFSKGGAAIVPRLPAPYVVQEVTPRKSPYFEGKMIPRSISFSAQRLLRYQNRIYGVARLRTDGQFYDGANILVYSVAHSGKITDVCYLEQQAAGK